MFARQYPDSGSIKTMLSDIDKRIEDWLKPYEEEVTTIPILEDSEPKKEKITKQRRLVGGSVRAMSAICAQIALENVGCCHYALRVLSRISLTPTTTNFGCKTSRINKTRKMVSRHIRCACVVLLLEIRMWSCGIMSG